MSTAPAGQLDRSKTGVAGLDDILSGGFLPHRMYLVDRNPGAGKTTLTLQYLMERVRRGEKGANDND